MTGVDISDECVSLARAEQPTLEFTQADIGEMPFEDGAFEGLVAYYALHYEPRVGLARIVREFARVLRPGGKLLVVAKDGDEEHYIADPLGSGQQVFWCAVPELELRTLLESNGFQVTSSRVREPQPDEIGVKRIYITATRSA
jgi:SAM-dependent methyltransferase